MPKWPLVGYDGATRLDGASIYSAFGTDHHSGTEADTQQEVRDTYTASNLRLYLSSWVGGAGVDDMIATFRVGAADGNQTITINATGEHEDTTNTDSLSSGNLIDVHFDHSAGGHADEYTVETFQVTLDASSDVPPIMSGGGVGAGDTWSANDDFVPLQGAARDQSSESNSEYTMRATRTLIDFRVYALTNPGTAPVITVRKNRANPASGLTVTVNATGEFLDTTNNVSYVAGDEANYGASSTDGGSSAISVRSVEADTSSGVHIWTGRLVSASTTFFTPSGEDPTTTELNAQIKADDAATIQFLFVNCFTYAETRTIRTRKNGANGAASVSVTGTGLFEDLSNTDSLVANNLLSIQQDAGSTGSNTYLVAVEWETSAGGTAHSASATFSGTGAMTALATHGNIAQVTMSGTGTLSSVATAGWLGKAAMSGTGAMTAKGLKGLLGKAVMNSTGAMTALATYGASGKATMSGAGSMDALATQGFQGKATMSGTGSLTALGGLVHGGAVTLFGVGTLSLKPALTHGAKAVLSGVGSMTAVGSRFVAGTVTMSGAGAMTAKATVAILGVVSMAGSGAMTAAGTLGHVAKVAFSGVGSMTVAGTRTAGGIAAAAASRIRWFTT